MSLIRLGVFGSAFDPPTLGHLDVLQQAAASHDRILLVPSAWHAFAKKPQPFNLRLNMLHCFIDDAADLLCPLEICDLEATLLKQNPNQPVYTYDLMAALEAQYANQASLCFIRGPDNARPETWSRFYKAQEIEARWPIFTAAQRVDARSSTVRKILESLQPADDYLQPDLNMLSPSVKAFILRHNLYKPGKP